MEKKNFIYERISKRIASEERSKAQREAEKMRQEFTANVSHELKTPLQSISGYAELLKSGMVKEEDVQQFAERIYSESQRMITLVNDILELSHLDEGMEDMIREDVDLYDVAARAVDSLEEEAAAAGVRFLQRDRYRPYAHHQDRSLRRRHETFQVRDGARETAGP